VFLVRKLIDCDNDAIEVEMRVEAVSVDVELTLARFGPAR
jgi:hypothetical protein